MKDGDSNKNVTPINCYELRKLYIWRNYTNYRSTKDNDDDVVYF